MSGAAGSQEIVRTQEMIERERRRVVETGKEAPTEIRALTPTEEAKQGVREGGDRAHGPSNVAHFDLPTLARCGSGFTDAALPQK